ncbi:MAG: hypothetical protein HYR84_03590 [Planctomycetes bacterium]|nr:hypothetical protein [Planctomycetota bacterium]
MAGRVLCVSCASLSVKDGAAAVKTTKCPECQSERGVTSYGAEFLIEAPRQSILLSPMVAAGGLIAACVLAGVLVVLALGVWTREQLAGPAPAPPEQVSNDLTRVPEVSVADAFPDKIAPADAKRRISELIAKIRQTNTPEKRDAFVLANMERRPGLRGLPFVMGDACRLNPNGATSFQSSVEAVRNALEADSQSSKQGHETFWQGYLVATGNLGTTTDPGIAALTQMLGPEKKTARAELVQHLRGSANPAATKAIARAAIFDGDERIRLAAVRALKNENKAHAPEVTDVLLYGIRYPMPIVAKRSAAAMIMLDRKDLLPQLVEILGEPAPTDPADAKVDNEPVSVVREVVRINHHRNCLLCHPPSVTGQTQEVPGVIPIPGNAFPTSPREAYGRAQSFGEPMVRADTTYLRQDFSVMMPVANASPWPDMQRFDFVVRTRVVTGKELAALEQSIKDRPANQLSANHKAVVRVLTELSGQRDVAPTQAAWQRVLGVGQEK